jgi:hypothetical protein
MPPNDRAAPPHRTRCHHLTCWQQSTLAGAPPPLFCRPEGESKVTFFDRRLVEYEQWRRKTLGEEVSRPHRITYRKLTR